MHMYILCTNLALAINPKYMNVNEYTLECFRKHTRVVSLCERIYVVCMQRIHTTININIYTYKLSVLHTHILFHWYLYSVYTYIHTYIHMPS